MKKLLKTLLISSLFTSTTSSVVACEPTAEKITLADLPDVNNVFINDTKEDIEIKALMTFVQQDIFVSGYAYNIMLETDSGKKEITNEYKAQNGDVLWFEIKNTKMYPYNDKKIIVDDRRINLNDFNLELHQKITISAFAELVLNFMRTNVSQKLTFTDYKLIINGKNETFSTKKDYIKQTDDIKIEAWTFSSVLYGEIIPNVIFKQVNLETMLDKVLLTLTQHTRSQNITTALEQTVPFWADDIEVLVQRQGENIVFDENYVTDPNDIITFKAKTESEWYFGSVSKTIQKEYYDDVLNEEVIVQAGIELSDLKEKISESIRMSLLNKDKKYKIDPDKIKFASDFPTSGRLTRKMTTTVTISDGFFTKPLQLKVIGAKIVYLELYKTQWTDYSTVISWIKEVIAKDTDLNYLSVEDDLLITESDGRVFDENWEPKESKQFSLMMITGKESSLYLDPINSYTNFVIENL